jgi:hypothetical protein
VAGLSIRHSTQRPVISATLAPSALACTSAQVSKPGYDLRRRRPGGVDPTRGEGLHGGARQTMGRSSTVPERRPDKSEKVVQLHPSLPARLAQPGRAVGLHPARRRFESFTGYCDKRASVDRHPAATRVKRVRLPLLSLGEVAHPGRAPLLQSGGSGFESHLLHHPVVAQLGSALASGARGRWFESIQPDC